MAATFRSLRGRNYRLWAGGALGPAIVSKAIAFGELTLVVQASDIVYALTYLRDDPACG